MNSTMIRVDPIFIGIIKEFKKKGTQKGLNLNTPETTKIFSEVLRINMPEILINQEQKKRGGVFTIKIKQK